ncbi:MAG: hypothetical protein HY706_21040 [Candidatus Hydrogenedentes bacterium]|nr:hypothetical protein [Candidatus Hydrogenedentota bacterium]
MTPRERVITALNRERPDRVPFELSFGAFTPALMARFIALTGETDPAEYWNFPVRSVGYRYDHSDELWRKYAAFYPPELPVGATISAFGIVSLPGTYYHFRRGLHPLRNATTTAEIVEFPLPDPTEPVGYAHLNSSVAALHGRGLAAQGDLYCTIFETAWGIRGMENLLTDFVLRPEMAEALLERLSTMRVIQARQLAESGVAILRLGDDIGMQHGMLMSPELWRHYLKPRLAQVIRAAREVKPDLHVFYHSDGNCEAVIPDLIEIGVTALNPVQPECMDPVALKAEFGDRLAFWGTVGTQSTMPFGTPEEVRTTVRDRIRIVGKNGGLVIAPTHVLEPEVPWKNILAFIDAVEEYGAY